MKKREKALREYLYTTPMILQYPNAFTGALIHLYYRLMGTIYTYPTQSPNLDIISCSTGCLRSKVPCQWHLPMDSSHN